MKQKIVILTSILFITVCITRDARAQWVKTPGSGRAVTCLMASGPNLFAGIDSSVFLSTNSGTSWTPINSGLPKDYGVETFAASGTDLYVALFGSGVFHSTNSGTNWMTTNSTSYVYSLAVNGSNLYAGGMGVRITTNNGTGWTETGSGLPSSAISCLAVSGANLFAGAGGPMFVAVGAFLSTDKGTRWSPVNNGLTNSGVDCFAVSGSNLFAGTYGGGVFLSTNSGTNWSEVNNGLANLLIRAFAVSDGGGIIFVGTEGGVFSSSNNGTSWMEVNTGLTDLHVTALAVSRMDLIAGTDTSGVWRLPLADFGDGVPQSSESGATDLRIYPNPASGLITLRGVPSDVRRIAISNMLGVDVVDVSGAEKPGGMSHNSEITLDLSRLPAGPYFLRIQAATGSVLRKVVRE